jgi:hypothetical protein
MEVTVNNLGNKVITIREEDCVAIVDSNRVQINQLGFERDPFKYESVFLSKDEIIALAEQLKKM